MDFAKLTESTLDESSYGDLLWLLNPLDASKSSMIRFCAYFLAVSVSLVALFEPVIELGTFRAPQSSFRVYGLRWSI